ncbi:MAG TPA: cellulase family glycosylhydrolase [bacterium]|nr:cellulase family glycosylhydrolase [bacterium]HPN44722.1 cellulase family glycosylhydrolase [bacterium]
MKKITWHTIRNLVISVIIFFTPSLTTAQSGIITFSGINSQTLEPLALDSIQIYNKTQNQATTLTGATSFDLAYFTSISIRQSAVIADFHLSENYPNSFQNHTRFNVFLTGRQEVTFTLYNILGRRVLEKTITLHSGGHTFTLQGGSLATGLYFLSARLGNEIRTIKILKTGVYTAGDLGLEYAGAGAMLPGNLQKSRLNPGDAYKFTGFSTGYPRCTLDNQTPAGGENFQFAFIPYSAVLPERWRGFNLLGKFTVEWNNEGYVEDDFIMIADLGFNFVRLPIDYRTYCEPGDWYTFNAAGLDDIDNAVLWGQEYGIHVCINLHRAPGYCVNPPSTPLPASENKSLWSDEEVQQVFADHWAMFAERYKNVPREALSFNLVNEPADITGEQYYNAMKPAIDAIRAISPERLIIIDGLNWANDPAPEFYADGIVQSPHFYQPFNITHYKAEWVDGSDSWPEPTWPVHLVPNTLYGYSKSSYQSPFILKANLAAGTTVSIHVYQVSTRFDMDIRADKTKIFTKSFIPGPGEGEWEQVIYSEEWKIYQNIYNKTYSAQVATDAQEISIRGTTGDWMTFTEIRITPPPGSGEDELVIIPAIKDWGIKQAGYYIQTANGSLQAVNPPVGAEALFAPDGYVTKWQAVDAQGIPVFVGEWGVYRFTPHDVTLAFMEDRLKAMQAAGLGWALWNFRGSFGILDSDREDVDYINYNGHQLDADMLDLLQQY